MEPPADARQLAGLFRVLSHPVRIQLLLDLRTPRHPSDLRIEAGAERADLQADRPLSRTTLLYHLAELQAHELVLRQDDQGRLVTNHAMLFHLLDRISSLSALRAFVDVDAGETRALAPAASGTRPTRVDGPRLVIVGGPREGVAFALDGVGPWTIGRGEGAHVRLDYDPRVSRESARVKRAGAGFAIEAVPGAMNPPAIDQMELPPGVPTTLVEGAILRLGASRLVFRRE